MWNTHRVGVTADNIVRYKASSLTVLRHSLVAVSTHDKYTLANFHQFPLNLITATHDNNT